MDSIRLKAYAKINFSLDITGKYENGYHKVEMIMHQINLHDIVLIRWYENNVNDFKVKIKTNKFFLPTDERNIAYKAAILIREKYGKDKKGVLRIDMKKNIPVAAGLAGGSSNAAAVLHGLNRLWNLELSLEKLCELGANLGADVPFSLMGQAKVNQELGKKMNFDPMATTCAIARGTGTELTPLKPVRTEIILSKPPISVSTKEVYQGIEWDKIMEHPDTVAMIDAVQMGNIDVIKKNMINVLENYTVRRYEEVRKTKNIMESLAEEGAVMMSGSGPTVFVAFAGKQELENMYENLKPVNVETIRTRTMI